MNNDTVEKQNDSGSALKVLAGILISGLTGAAVMLLLAPQSGEETREQIRDKGIQLRDQATGFVGDTISEVRSLTKKIGKGGQDKYQEFKRRGQDLAGEQLDHLANAAKASKKAIQGS